MFKGLLRSYLPQIFLLIIILLISTIYLYANYIDKIENSPLNTGFSVIRPPDEVSAIVLDEKYLWAGGREGLYKINVDSAKVIEYQNNLKYIRAIIKAKDGTLWVGHDKGISKLTNEKWSHITTKDGLCDNRVYSLIQDSKGRVWAGTWNGLTLFDNENTKIYTVEDGLLANMVNVIHEDSLGNMWFGSYIEQNGGVSILGIDGNWQYFSKENGLPHNYITSINEDSLGNVLVGTGLLDLGGACRFSFGDNKWTITKKFLKSDGLAGEKVRSIFFDKDNNLWLGSEYDGVTVLNKNGIKVITTETGLSDNEVKAMCQDYKGNIWLATRNGITRIESFLLEKLLNN